MEKRRILIKGPKVHDVGYRPFLLEEAESLLIPNFSAKNIKNETEVLEVLVGGDKERVAAFIEFAKKNYPEEAKIADIHVEEYEGEIRTIEAYSRSFSTTQLAKMSRTGLALLNNQKEHIDITKEGLAVTKEILNNQKEHIDITRAGFSSVTEELKGYKDVHREVLELRHEVNGLKNSVSRIEKKIKA